MVRTELAKKVVAEISRLLIGVVFIFSGIVKAIDPVGGAIKIGDYLMAFGFTWLSSFELLLTDRKSTRLNSSHITRSRMPSSA